MSEEPTLTQPDGHELLEQVADHCRAKLTAHDDDRLASDGRDLLLRRLVHLHGWSPVELARAVRETLVRDGCDARQLRGLGVSESAVAVAARVPAG